MTWKNALLIGTVSSALATIAGVVFTQMYQAAFMVDFSAIVGTVNVIAASVFGCFLMAIGYRLAYMWRKDRLNGWLNVVYAVLSFMSIIGIFGFNLPLDVQSPEMFPGLVVPMHFFPIIAFLTVLPFFKNQEQ